MFKIFEAGNALDVLTSQQAPHADHQTAVGNREVGREHGAPICLVFAQSSETRAGRRHQKASMMKHERDGFINIAVEKADAENLSSGRGADIRHERLCYEIAAGSISSTPGK